MSSSKDLEKRRAALCAALRDLGVDARILERDPLSPEPFRDKNDEDPIVWIEIADGPIRWVDPFSAHRYWYWYVPDSRLEPYLELDYAEVYAEHKIPWFRGVERVEWHVGGPYKIEPRDYVLYELVAEILAQDTAVSEAIMTAHSKVEVLVYAEARCWLICDEYSRSVTRTVTLPIWDCYQAIANALLAMPMPPDE